MKPLVLSFSASRYDEPTTFGEYIRKARLEKGLKQRELAARVGVNEMTIANWERYATAPKRHHAKIRALCPSLNLSYEGIIGNYAWVATLLA